MRFNEKELINYSSQMATKEGRVYYKNPNAGFREGKFVCFNNCFLM